MKKAVRKEALILRTDCDQTYMLEALDGRDPGIRMKNVVSTLSERGPFLPCRDMFGDWHYVNADHIIEIYVGIYSVSEEVEECSE